MKWTAFALAWIVLCATIFGRPATAAEGVDYLRDIKPILATRCYRCHSSLAQESNLRLDSPSAITKGGDNGAAIVPRKSGESKLLAAVLRQGDLKMPPEGEPLSPAQIELLKSWIDGGAIAPADGEVKVDHWSFKKPVRPTVPTPANAAYLRNPVDAFVAAKHEELKLTPVGEAPKNLLLRRLYLDLIGLPPTPQEMQAFLADSSPDAYDKVVTRLLDSKHHGERWGRHWMDVWRYSDWDGYGAEVRESQPHIWRWRDWIVESLNADKPYDRMIVEMLAADELAPEDPATLRATGYLVRNWYKFNRNSWLDASIEHTGKAFMGVTFNCARCHDHMYDPISQEEYYSLRAVFEPHNIRTDRLPGQSDTAKDGLARIFDADVAVPTYLFIRGNDKDPVKDKPLSPAVPKLFRDVAFQVQPVTLPAAATYPGLQTYIQEESLAAARADVEKAAAAVATAQMAVTAAKQKQTEFLKEAAAKPPADDKPADSPPQPLLSDDFSKQRDDDWKIGAGKWEFKDGHLTQSEPRDELCAVTAVKAHPQDFLAKFRFKTTGGKMWKSVGLAFDAVEQKDFQAVYLSVHSPGPHLWQRIAGQDQYPVSSPKATAVEVGREIELQIAVRGSLANIWVDGKLVLAYQIATQRVAEGKLILWTYDATAEFIKFELAPLPATQNLVMADGKAGPMTVVTAEGMAAMVSDAEMEAAIAEKAGTAAQAALVAMEARIAADRATFATPPAANAKELALAAGKAERQLALLGADKAVLTSELAVAKAKRAIKPDDMATTKAATDAETALQTAVKAREAAMAAVEQPNEAYTKLTPVYPATSTGRRLALAQFIASKDNPLTARVAINHIWLRHFGTPLVPSVFDFGMNGKPPTNGPLLDWLASELMDNNWSMKHIHRLIVTSRTYRLHSTSVGATNSENQPADVALVASNSAIDPENRYYWRQNPRRMEAEVVRDATLQVAGSLDVTMGGAELDQDAGLTSGRRSIYFRSTKEKKMQFLSLFDSPNVVECYRRSESISPQQALAMANSSLTLSQARILAKRIIENVAAANSPAANPPAEQTDGLFVAEAFERILCRAPSANETQTCQEFLGEQSKRLSAMNLSPFSSGPAATVLPSADPRQRARENLVHVLLNHNDFLTVR